MNSGPVSAFESETFGQDASFRLEQPIGSMSISPSGRDIALASKEGLHIIDLDSPYSPPRYLPHRTPWEVADVQWSPFAARDYWVVSTSNQKALVWNLEAKGWQDTIEFVLHAHTRAITDINFSAHNPDILATCAVDTFVHCWDLRNPQRPAFSFSDWFAGATQVKWSRQNEHVVASSHDKLLHIWDKRKGAYPLRTIEAHGTKIYGVDWNRFHPNKIVTCSLDRTVKFWDCDNPEDVPERVIETPFPVWRARHTPFGWGLLAMPQRGSSDLYLYDRRPIDGHYESGHVRPVAKFAGHEGQVKEFLWRARGTIIDGVDHRDFQLVSWGTDRELRLHRVEPETFEGIGYEKGHTKSQKLNFTRRGARYKTFRDSPDDTLSPSDPHPRMDSIAFPNQFLAFRQRTSTNIGMNKIPVSQFRGWVSGNKQASRIAMHGKASAGNDINPIAWLKNVKIASWDPDTLAEEIRHVGEKFQRVDFETVDIRHRKAIISLQAPWGDQQSSVYLRVDFRFPKAYPRGANAQITLQKTGAIDEILQNTMHSELNTVSEKYAAQKKGCLEAVLRYLLREQTLDQIINWLGDSLTDSKILDTDILPGDESSDSDDDALDGLGEAMAASANVRVPLAKGCGALWSDSGKLVCFFPPKSEEPASMLENLSVGHTENSQSSKIFEGFGRLHTSSPARKATNGTRTVDEVSDSDSSDSILSSSSSSSSSSEPETEIHDSLRPYKKGIVGYAQRSQSPNRSNRSTTAAGTKLGYGVRRTVVSIHEYEDLLPASRSLAENYKIYGPQYEVCAHNADIALAAKRADLASAWTLAQLILANQVPLELVKHPFDESESDIMVVANRAVAKSGRGNSTVTEQQTIRPSGNNDFGSLKWGKSPLAAFYLIPALFDYFDRIADIQMLGMLACVFNKSPFDKYESVETDLKPMIIAPGGLAQASGAYYSSVYVAESLLRPQPPMNGHAMVRAISDAGTVQPSTVDDRTKSTHRFASVSDDAPDINRRRHLSRNPSVIADDDHESIRSVVLSASYSPEGNRLNHRASMSGTYSTAQASLAALTQSYSSSPPAQNSSGGQPASMKKFSPSSSSLTPGWVTGGIFSGVGVGRVTRAPSQSEAMHQDRDTSLRSSISAAQIRNLRRDGRATPDTYRRGLKSSAPSETSEPVKKPKPGPRKRILKSSLHNQDRFDIDNRASLPLLSPELELRCKIYRANYAHLLEVWQLHMQKAEIMMYDDLSSATSLPNNPMERRRRRTLIAETSSNDVGLQIRRCCRSCKATLAAIEKNGVAIGWHCINPACSSVTGRAKVSKRRYCSVCNKAIRGLSIPCIQCGHLTCYDCAREWFGQNNKGTEQKRETKRRSSSSMSDKSTALDGLHDDDVEEDISHMCPTGCGCACSMLTNIDVPEPAIATQQSDSQQRSNENLKPYTSTPIMTTTNTMLQPITRRPSVVRATSAISEHSRPAADREGLTSESHPVNPENDTAIAAFLAHARIRSKSATKAKVLSSMTPASNAPVEPTSGSNAAADIKAQLASLARSRTAGSNSRTTDHNDGSWDVVHDDELDELNPWLGSKIATLGKGSGPGLSRGLNSRGSKGGG